MKMGSDVESKSFIIREWTEEDCEEIMNMIVGLAIFEKMPEQVNITAETLKKDGFGPKAFFSCFVAEDLVPSEQPAVNGRRPLIGYALHFYKYSTWEGRCIYLEDIFVQEKHRKRGIGLALFRAIAQLAVKEDCSRIDFGCVAWNKSSIDFYEKLGAVNLTTREEWNFFRLERLNIKKLADS